MFFEKVLGGVFTIFALFMLTVAVAWIAVNFPLIVIGAILLGALYLFKTLTDKEL